MRTPIFYWPDGIVHYRFDFQDKQKKKYFDEAFKEIENKTCVRYRQNFLRSNGKLCINKYRAISAKLLLP
jgi:hypothetical protein